LYPTHVHHHIGGLEIIIFNVLPANAQEAVDLFLSHLCGGERFISPADSVQLFLSHLCGTLVFLLFLFTTT
jgi:hypothetical protein